MVQRFQTHFNLKTKIIFYKARRQKLPRRSTGEHSFLLKKKKLATLNVTSFDEEEEEKIKFLTSNECARKQASKKSCNYDSLMNF